MVRNRLGEFQRRVIVSRSEPCLVEARLSAVIHGKMEPEGGLEATLIVMDFRFQSVNPSRRIKSAEIVIRFKACDPGQQDPKPGNMAPLGKYHISNRLPLTNDTLTRHNAQHEGRGHWVDTSASSVTVLGIIRSGDVTHTSNEVLWKLESSTLEASVPSAFRGAILLERHPGTGNFMCSVDINTDLSGISFDLFGRPEKDDPVLFDPHLEPFGDFHERIDRRNLGDLDLEPYGELALHRIWPTEATINPRLERAARQEVEGVLDSAAQEVTPGSAAERATKTFYLDLWNLETESTKTSEMQEDAAVDEHLDQEGDANCGPLSVPLDKTSLSVYFPWVTPKSEPTPVKKPGPSSQASPQGEGQERTGATQEPDQQQQDSIMSTGVCRFLALRADTHGFTNYNLVKTNLLVEPSTETILDFFHLPEIYGLLRRHDRGTCQQIPLHQVGEEVLSKVYVIQTPFYTQGFWSLVLHTTKSPGAPDSASRTCGILQCDKDTDLTTLTRNILLSAAKWGHHPMLLPTQLFVTHFRTTMTLFQSLLDRIAAVEAEILRQLDKDKHSTDYAEKAAGVHQSISMTLHRCSMELAELGRRTKFEEELSARLVEDLKQGGRDAQTMVAMLSVMSKSRQPDIDELPAKIEGLRNVLYSLITQHDSFLQSVMTQESLRDSKAMKTLAVLTILFLPGAFLASVFSTDMFEFQSNAEEIGIFVGITVPLTLALMVGWLLWLRMTWRGGYRRAARGEESVEEGGGGEETGGATTPGMPWWKGFGGRMHKPLGGRRP
ncbi:hypothetical protein QBC47DRAFT_85167 [Echria macrotheca]|uniref:Uncharacterized protein n=1 Tax=Echria macrotheca TaxID=438768 RepID=A0AAJ0B856_9PEZI|nr:hypothetical protein QBC47DRAFT_85167 [Echria macrotheca]